MPLPALAGPALVAGSQLITHFAPQKEVSGGPKNDGYMNGDGFLATAGTALAGGAAGAALRRADLGPDASIKDKIGATITGGALGTGSGLLANIQHDAIHRDGGTLTSMVAGAGSAMLASKLQKDGPNMIQAALIGGGSGITADILHDKATDKGYGLQADLAADALQGSTLGYVAEGGWKGAAGGAALGAAAGYGTNKLTESQYDPLAGLNPEQRSLIESEGAESAVQGQRQGQGGMADGFVAQHNAAQQAAQPTVIEHEAPAKDGGPQLG